MKGQMILLKLGGSVVTDKKQPFTIRKEVIKRLSKEIKTAQGRDIIIVHGGGSFGHPMALRYRIQDGLKKGEDPIGVSETRKAMEELNNYIMGELIGEGIPALSMQSSALFTCHNKRIVKGDLGIVKGFLDLGSVPVLYGDVVLDSAQGICILSGDQIITYLAEKLDPEMVLLATDVDGVLDNQGKLIKRITPEKKEDILTSIKAGEGDVTGGMAGKVEELIKLSRKGTSSIVFNATAKERLRNALLGNNVIGTLFED